MLKNPSYKNWWIWKIKKCESHPSKCFIEEYFERFGDDASRSFSTHHDVSKANMVGKFNGLEQCCPTTFFPCHKSANKGFTLATFLLWTVKFERNTVYLSFQIYFWTTACRHTLRIATRLNTTGLEHQRVCLSVVSITKISDSEY